MSKWIAITVALISALAFLSLSFLANRFIGNPKIRVIRARAVVETQYACTDDKPISEAFTPIMSVARIFQMTFFLTGTLKPCTIVSEASHERVTDEPVATFGGAVFVERLVGRPEKCLYVLRESQKEDFDAMIVFDRLSAEYKLESTPYGDPILDVKGSGRAVCTQFHNPRVLHGLYADDSCSSDLSVVGQARIDVALRALRYVFAGICPHVEFRPY